MTATGDYIEDNQALDQGPAYPTAFGIELTPRVQAILLALLGLLGAYLMYNYLVRPVQQQKRDLEQQVADKQAQVQQQSSQLQQVAQLEAELGDVLDQRVGVYELLGDRRSLDTLLLDINQQIENSNATIENVIQGDFNNVSGAQLAALGLNQQQIAQVRNRLANDPVLQRSFYTSELGQFNPAAPVPITDSSLGTELNGKLERYTVAVTMRALYPQTLSILRNIERLEPLVIIRDFRQDPAPLRGDLSEEDIRGLSRPLSSSFTLDVLVPTVDPTVPPTPPPPPAEGAPADGTTPPPAEGQPPG
ncbi:MAG TPA: hypothetical protein V6D06_05885 [Trichocoleus sp.]